MRAASRGLAGSRVDLAPGRQPSLRQSSRSRFDRFELDVVAREVHERLLERSLLRRQLVERRSGEPRPMSPICAAVRPRTSISPPGSASTTTSGPASSSRSRGAAASGRGRRLPRSAGGRTSSMLMSAIKPAAADHDQVIGGQRHLAHQVGRDEDRAALGCEPPQQVAHPVNPLRVEPVDRLVEHHRLRISDQRRRDPEPLTHAERELARALACAPPGDRRARSAR